MDGRKHRMDGRRCIVSGLFAAVLATTARPALANSSWIWFTQARPWHLLPLAVLLTLGIEAAALLLFVRPEKPGLGIAAVTVANLLSFAMPYALKWLICLGDGLYPFRDFIEHGPVYTVGTAFLLMTLLVEIPVVCQVMKKHVSDRKRLFLTLLFSNVVTTSVCAAMERLLCPCRW